MVNHILSQWLTIFNHINMEISWNIHILGHLYENNIKIFEVIGLLGKVMTIHWMLGMIFWRKLHLSGSEAEGL